jgi:hypothetical protein
MSLSWPLPKNDPWSTPFAEVLLEHLDIFSGATILDIASGTKGKVNSKQEFTLATIRSGGYEEFTPYPISI